MNKYSTLLLQKLFLINKESNWFGNAFIKRNIFFTKSKIYKFNEPNPSYDILFIFFGKKLFFKILPKDIIILSLNDNSSFGLNKLWKSKFFGKISGSFVFIILINLEVKFTNRQYILYLVSKFLLLSKSEYKSVSNISKRWGLKQLFSIKSFAIRVFSSIKPNIKENIPSISIPNLCLSGEDSIIKPSKFIDENISLINVFL